MGLPAFNIEPEAGKLVLPILKIYDPHEPSNIIALFPDESKGKLDPKWVPKRGTVAPHGKPVIANTASASQAVLGVGVLIGWELAEQDYRAKQAAAELAAQPFVDEFLGKRLQGMVEIILSTEIAALAALALDVARRDFNSASSVKRTKIHGYSKR